MNDRQVDEYIREHTRRTLREINRDLPGSLVPDISTPEEVAEVLTARYGRPETIDRGEVAYWQLDAREAARIAEDD